jgi:hypothetical protein
VAGQTLNAWETRIREILGNLDTTTLPTGPDVENAVKAAVRRFSEDRPRVVTADFVGNGSSFDFNKPSSWVDGFSEPIAVEYPTGKRPAEFLDQAEVGLYPDISSPTSIRLNETTPANGLTARLYYSVPWPIPDTTTGDQVPDGSFEPVCHLAASVVAEQMAARAAGHKRPNIPSADIAGVELEEDRWLKLAATARAYYEKHVGGTGGPAPASLTTDWDIRASWIWTGRTFIFRGRR